MTNPTVTNFFIGTRPILDTAQGNGVMENASTLLGNYTVGTDAVYHTLQAQHDPIVVDGLLATNDYGASALNPDGLFNEGFTNTVSGGFSELDSQQLFLANVSYHDLDGVVKTMTNVPMNVYQLENGDTYMAPTTEIVSPTSGLLGDSGEFIASVLSGRDILNVELTTLRTDPIGRDNLLYDHESAQDTVQTFYLGNKSILDTTQGDGDMEAAGTLLGSYDATTGSVGSGQFARHTLTVRHDARVNDELLATNDYGASAFNPDGLFDEGFANAPTAGQNGTTFSELDSQQLFWGNVTYIDASGNTQVMTNVALNVYQLENGDVFAVPTREIVSGNFTVPDASDITESVLAGLNITRIELTSLRNDPIGRDSLLFDSESIEDGGFSAVAAPSTRDGIVDGTDAAQLMNPGFQDAQGDLIDGTDGLNDSIRGNGGNDSISAGAGDDTVDGGTGDDRINGESGNDRLIGGDGNDSINFGTGNDTVFGGAGDDVFDDLGGTPAGTGDNFVDAGTGNDFMYDGSGNDTFIGGDGNDTFVGDNTGSDQIFGGAGDSILGGADADTIVIDVNALDAAGLRTAGIIVNGGATGVDNDTLNLSDYTSYRNLVQTNDADGNSTSGTVEVIDAAGVARIVTFAEIENLLLPAQAVVTDGDVDGAQTGEFMGVGYTDAQGDAITEGADSIRGNGGVDNIDGAGGNDTIAGGDGNDFVQGGLGDDNITGDAGNDFLLGGAGNDSLAGGDGADTLTGGAGADVLDGGLSDDDILVGGADTAMGGAGDDVFTLDATDPATNVTASIDGGADATDGSPAGTENGDAGDTLDLSGHTTGLTVTLGTNPESGTVNGLDGDGTPDITFSEIENVLTGTGNDTIAAGASTGPVDVAAGDGDDVIATGAGNDTVDAGTGNDLVNAGTGDDSVLGNAGQDTLSGGAGNDTLDGGSDDDTLDGGADDDSLTGGTGDDGLTGGDGTDTLDGGDGSDTLVGGLGADQLTGGAGDDDIVLGAGDTATGGSGDDVFSVDPALTGTAPITILGGETEEEAILDPSNNPDGRIGDVLDLTGLGEVEVIYDSTDPSFNPVTGTAERGTATYINDAGQPVTINFSQIEAVQVDADPVGPDGVVNGTSGADRITPTSGPGLTPFTDAQGDQVDGSDSFNDVIDAGAGNDTVNSGSGNDVIVGDTGNDNLTGGIGNDSLYGGDGGDRIDGGTGDDLIEGAAGRDTMIGGNGDDTLAGGDGVDNMTGGAGDDLMDGGSGNDVLRANFGSDTLNGGEGADQLYGGSDDDTLIIGAGDVARGDAGDDVFTIDAAQADTATITVIGGETGENLTDPTNGGDGDVLDLRGLNGVTVTANTPGAEAGVATFLNADGQTVTINYSEIETVLTDNQDETPTLQDDMAEVDEDDAITIDVLANDTDPNGDPLTVTDASAPNGTVAINADGTISYTPNPDFNGEDTITYTVTDPDGNTATGTVAVSVAAVEDAPTTGADTADVDEDDTVTIDVLANDSDVDGGDLTVTDASAPNGTVAINADGTISYTPNPDFNGEDTITYTVTDPEGNTSTATVSVSVAAVEDAPVAEDDVASTVEDTSVVIDVLANDTDADGGALSVVAASAENGTVRLNGDGTITYTPDPDFNGDDTISYTVSDPEGNTSEGSVGVTVEPADVTGDGVVDGEETAENIGLGYTDASGATDGGGDAITNGNDVIDGNGGNDTINGAGGNDTIDGGAGNDVVNGDAGDDTLLNNAGDDTMTGGEGEDTYVGTNPGHIYVQVDANGGAEVREYAQGSQWFDAPTGLDQVSDVEHFDAAENSNEIDKISFTRAIQVSDIPTAIQGLSDNAEGVFWGADGSSINFGLGQDYQLSDILNGTSPGEGLPAVSPVGEYFVFGGDEDAQINDTSFDDFEEIFFKVEADDPALDLMRSLAFDEDRMPLPDEMDDDEDQLIDADF